MSAHHLVLVELECSLRENFFLQDLLATYKISTTGKNVGCLRSLNHTILATYEYRHVIDE